MLIGGARGGNHDTDTKNRRKILYWVSAPTAPAQALPGAGWGAWGGTRPPPPVTVAKCPPTARLPDKPGGGAKSWAAAGGAPPPQHPTGGGTQPQPPTPRNVPSHTGDTGQAWVAHPSPSPPTCRARRGGPEAPPPGQRGQLCIVVVRGGGPGRRVPGTWQRRPLLCLPGGTRRARPRPQILGQGTEKGT